MIIINIIYILYIIMYIMYIIYYIICKVLLVFHKMRPKQNAYSWKTSR